MKINDLNIFIWIKTHLNRKLLTLYYILLMKNIIAINKLLLFLLNIIISPKLFKKSFI